MGEDLKKTDLDLFSAVKRRFDLPDADIRTYSPLTLAYIGDGIYEVIIRSAVSGSGGLNAAQMNKRAGALVRAQAQSEMMKHIRPLLSREEDDYYRRGRNAHPHTRARHATRADYMRATGFETLMGYLYLTGRTERMLELIKTGMDAVQSAPQARDLPEKSENRRKAKRADGIQE